MAEAKCLKIVVAEDNNSDVTLVREALKLHGIDGEVVVIRDGAEAVQYFRGVDLDSRLSAPDIVLLDMHLPKCDGADILTALRSTERIAQTPVVVMTSSEAPRDYENAQKNAVLHYFRKPSNLSQFMQLGNVVRTILFRSNKTESQEPGAGATNGGGAA